MIGALTLGVARLFVTFPVEHPAMPAVALVGTSLAFSALGIVVGLYSTGWDQQNVVGNPRHPAAGLPGRRLLLRRRAVDAGVAVTVTLGLAAARVGWAWVTLMHGVGIRT